MYLAHFFTSFSILPFASLYQSKFIYNTILKYCVDKGGTITGEHGVGVEKIDQMCHQFQSAELKQFHFIKAQLDHSGILNPGKAIPSLHRCAELGAMHVHNGELAHPELPRF